MASDLNIHIIFHSRHYSECELIIFKPTACPAALRAAKASALMTSSNRPAPPKGGMTARRLISIDDLSDSDIAFLLDLTEHYAGYLTPRRNRAAASCRAAPRSTSFLKTPPAPICHLILAGKKLGADVVNVPVNASSVHKGESLVDTAQTLAAMGADIMIVRAKEPGPSHEAR